jgi:(p)ppGpp synthase/HD superfamily hydrolase
MECSEKYLEAIRFAAWQHALAEYDGRPYYSHFKDGEQVLRDHNEYDEESAIQFNLHDVLEGTDLSYGTIKKLFGFVIAEVVYLCTDNKGRTRDDRKDQRFYDEIKQSELRLQATKIKVADRLANARRSIKNKHSMGEKYIKEYPHFKEELYVLGHIESMWKELDELMKGQ